MTDLEESIRRIVREEVAKAKADQPTQPELVTVAAYCLARSISQSTVRQAIADERIEVVRIGRAVRIPVNAVIRRRGEVDEITRAARLRLMRGGKR